MDVSVVHPSELGRAERASWRALVAGDPRLASPFLTPEFTALVGRVRGDARVAVISDGPTTAFFPHERHQPGVARPIGIGMADCEGLVAPAELELDGPGLLRACGLLLWRFHHLLGHQAAAMASHAVEVASPLIDLEGGFERYLEERRQGSKTLLESAGRKARKLEREVGEVRLEFDDRDHARLERLVGWKRDQYARTGVPDVLARRGVSELLHLLLDTPDPGFGGLLSTLHAGDRLVAAHMGVRTPAGIAWWLPAYDPEFARYSPGVTLVLRVAREAADQEFSWIDLGKGDELYKQRLKSCDLPLADGWVARRGVRRPYELLRRARRIRAARRAARPPAASGDGPSPEPHVADGAVVAVPHHPPGRQQAEGGPQRDAPLRVEPPA